MKIKTAACQFPISSDILANSNCIQQLLVEAAKQGAGVILFPECSLSGYVGHHIETFDDYDWRQLEEETVLIKELAVKHGLWVIFGSVHKSGNEHPKICQYIVNPKGLIEARYDKISLYGKEEELCTPGSSLKVVDIHGVKCGFLICYDSCFPKLYEEYENENVELIFHSFYNAGNNSEDKNFDRLVCSQLITRAADHRVWIAASNSSLQHSRIASGFYGPDGTQETLNKNQKGIIYKTFPCNTIGWTYDTRTSTKT